MPPQLLVITSCTASKRSDPPNALQQHDFGDAALLRQREHELAAYRCLAADMYTGPQHLHVVGGVRVLRAAGVQCKLAILSAGYGLIAEDRPIVPYDVTFAAMSRTEARRWAAFLGIPAAVRAAIRPYPLVIFLLGDKYLAAIDPPIHAAPGQRLLYFVRPAEARVSAPGVVAVEAGRAQCSIFGAGYMALKGAMFAALARAIASEPARWLPAVQADDTDRSVRQALETDLSERRRSHV